MTGAPSKRAARSPKNTAKFAARRTALARAALSTLSQLGYARSSLREIAQNSQFSHGVLHYYFEDKTDLILCSIREFKIDSIARFEASMRTAQDLPTMLERLDRALEIFVREDGATNRFWYDLRAQALFDPRFRPRVMEIYTTVQTAVGRFLEQVWDVCGIAASLSPDVGYALFDGLFQQCMLRHAAGDSGAIGALQASVHAVIEGLVRGGAAGRRDP